MPNDLKNMSAVDIKKYVRTLEEQTGELHPMDEDQLDGMTFFEVEDLVADLEKDRDLRKMSR